MVETAMESNFLNREPRSSISEVVEFLRMRSKDTHDLVVDVSELSMDSATGELAVGGHTSNHLNAFALGQLAGKLSIPGAYLQRCDPELRAENVNRWLRERSGNVLLRMEGDTVRAVLSTRYQPLDNLKLVQMLEKSLGADTRVRWELSDTRFEMQVIGAEADESQDQLYRGLHVGNSEVGAAAISVSALIYRSICLNGLILGYGRTRFTRRHVGEILASEVDEQVRNIIVTSATSISHFKGTRSIRVKRTSQVIERIVKRYELTSQQHDAITAAFYVEPGETLYHTINAITRAGNAEKLSLEARRELQEVGGRIVEAVSTGSRWLPN